MQERRNLVLAQLNVSDFVDFQWKILSFGRSGRGFDWGWEFGGEEGSEEGEICG